MRWRRQPKRESGWAVVEAGREELAFVHSVGDGSGRPQVVQYSVRACGADAEAWTRAARDIGLARYRCVTLLNPDDYQVLLIDALKVPRDEWKAAARWRIKDLLDYSVDEASVDVLDIPAVEELSVRAQQIFAIAARKRVVAECVQRFDAAAVPLSVIDIPETAQRNIATLYAEPGRAIGMIYFDDAGGCFTISYGGELYMTRRIEIGNRELAVGADELSAGARDRVLLEVQRSLDHFERQYNHMPLSRIALAPEPRATGLAAHLAANLALPVVPVDLAEVLDLPAGGVAPALQWRLFNLIGASLRVDAKPH